MQEPPDDPDGLPRPAEATRIVSAVESTADGTPVCTLYPESAEGMDLMTRWISAQGDAFVPSEERR